MTLRAEVTSPQAAAEIAGFLESQGHRTYTMLEGSKYCVYTADTSARPKPKKKPVPVKTPLLTATEREFAYWIGAVILGFLFIKYVL